jgi:hypothetical protein
VQKLRQQMASADGAGTRCHHTAAALGRTLQRVSGAAVHAPTLPAVFAVPAPGTPPQVAPRCPALQASWRWPRRPSCCLTSPRWTPRLTCLAWRRWRRTTGSWRKPRRRCGARLARRCARGWPASARRTWAAPCRCCTTWGSCRRRQPSSRMRRRRRWAGSWPRRWTRASCLRRRQGAAARRAGCRRRCGSGWGLPWTAYTGGGELWAAHLTPPS